MEALDWVRYGRLREGTEALKEVITAKKNVSTAYLNLAWVYKDQQRVGDAIVVLEVGLESLPENYNIFFQYIVYLFEAGRWADALTAFETRRFSQVEFDPIIWNYAGLSYWRSGDTEKAEECFEKSISIDQKFAIPYSNLGNLYAFLFRKTNDQAVYRKAIESYKKAIELDPSYADSYYGLGTAYLQAGNYKEAISLLEKALELQPDIDQTLYQLGMASMRAGDYSKAYLYFTKFKSSPTFDLLSSSEKTKVEEYIQRCKQSASKAAEAKPQD